MRSLHFDVCASFDNPRQTRAFDIGAQGCACCCMPTNPRHACNTSQTQHGVLSALKLQSCWLHGAPQTCARERQGKNLIDMCSDEQSSDCGGDENAGTCDESHSEADASVSDAESEEEAPKAKRARTSAADGKAAPGAAQRAAVRTVCS